MPRIIPEPTLIEASDVSYNNTTSGLIGTNVQDAIDELVTLIGTGGPHDTLDTLVHRICETSYDKITRDSDNKIINHTIWDSILMSTKIRETIITRTNNKISKVEEIQYDNSGVEVVRCTENIMRECGKISNITRTQT